MAASPSASSSVASAPSPLRLTSPDDAARDGALRVSDACAFVGVSRSTIYKLARDGALTPVRVAGRTVFLRSELVALLAAGMQQR
jgi:excisionase family DNA binding protein